MPRRILIFLSAATFVLIAAGGLVTSTGSGLSVPDWPLSYGMLFPPMIGGIRFEHSHRVIAGFVGLVTLFTTFLVWKTEQRAWMKKLALGALALVVAQAVLGGLTVIYLLPTWVSVAHACMGQTFFSLIVLMILFTSKEWTESLPAGLPVPVSALRLFGVTTFFIYAQLVMGSYVRHTAGSGVNWHIGIAVLIVMHVFFILLRCARQSELRGHFMGHALFLTFLVLTQVSLGFGAYFTKLVMPKAVSPRLIEVLVATAHQATGALVLAMSAVLTARAARHYAAGRRA